MSPRNLGHSLSSPVFINSWLKKRLVCGTEAGKPGVGLLGLVSGPRHLGGSHSLATATQSRILASRGSGSLFWLLGLMSSALCIWVFSHLLAIGLDPLFPWLQGLGIF